MTAFQRVLEKHKRGWQEVHAKHDHLNEFKKTHTSEEYLEKLRSMLPQGTLDKIELKY